MTTCKEINEFFERQLKLLREERDAEAAQNALLLSKCSPKLLEQRGLALLNLIPVSISIGIGGRNLVEVSRNPAVVANPDATLPPHSFRPGDIARLEKTASNGSMPKKASEGRLGAPNESLTEGIVYKVTESRIILAIDPRNRQDNEDLDLPNVCNLVKLANTATNDRMAKVTSALQASLTGEASSDNMVLQDTRRVIDVLLGLKSPDAVEIDTLNFYDETLNEGQRRAVQFALGSKEVACIHGPPGTGKTHTLLEIIRQSLCPRFAQKEPAQILRPVKKMLVCGASNLSVDNILERLLLPPLPGMRPIKCTRLGHPARVKGQASSLDATLDSQSSRSEGAKLVKDIKTELSENLLLVSGHARGQKGRKPRGEERRKLWEEIKALRQEYRRREKGVVNTILSEAEVVFATCHTAGGRAIEHMEFDIVIIDEATQALEAACWIPIIKGKKVILAGDPLQLPPTVLAQPHSSKTKRTTKQQATRGSKAKSVKTSGSGQVDDESETSSESLPEPDVRSINLNSKSKPKSNLVLRPSKDLSVTLFERLEKMYGESIKRMLQIQYRMHEKISEFPSKALYGSRLHSEASVAHHLLLDLPGTSKDHADLLSSPVVFLDTSGSEYYERSVEEGDEGSKYNENEATLVKAWLEKLVAAGIHPSQVAVITPYQAQVSYISSLLSGEYGSELEIGTVDGMQGREKEAIILSLVRSNDKREVGFLKDKRRLNVAMTRARRHMCVIGDSSTVQHGGKFLKEWMSWLEDSAEVYFGGLDELP